MGEEGKVGLWAEMLYEKERVEQGVNEDGSVRYGAVGINEWVREPLVDSGFRLRAETDGTVVSPEVAAHVGDGAYEATMTMSQAPQLNTVTFQSTHLPPRIRYKRYEGSDLDPNYVTEVDRVLKAVRVPDPERPYPADGAVSLWGVKPEITEVAPAPILLTDSSTTQGEHAVHYSIEPAEFAAELPGNQVFFALRKGGTLVAEAIGADGAPFTIPRGMKLEPGVYDAFLEISGVWPEGDLKSAPLPVLAGEPVDLDVDSNNNNVKAVPERTEGEDALEDVEGRVDRPGKVFFVNGGDTDGDGIPDFADGMDRFGTPKADESEGFVPIVLELPQGFDLSQATVKLSYPASDPAGVTREGSEEEGYTYIPAPGALRVWTKDGKQPRKAASIDGGGDFVAPDQEYPVSALGAPRADNTWTLYVESVVPSAQVAADRILVEAKLSDGQGGIVTLEDAVRTTSLEMPLVEPQPDNSVRTVRDVTFSHPSPVVTVSDARLTNLRLSEDNTQVLGDLVLAGQVSCAVCDYTPGEQGTIDTVRVFLNDTTEPLTSLPVSASKALESPSFLRPYALTATFSGIVEGVQVNQGGNVIVVDASDKVYGITGYSELSVGVTGTEPSAVSVDYRVSLDFGGATTLSEITPATPVGLTVVDRVGGTTFAGEVFKTSDAPLSFGSPEATVTVLNVEQLEAALSPTAKGSVLASVILHSVVRAAVSYEMAETASASSLFRREVVHLGLTKSPFFRSDVPDTVDAVIDDGRSGPVSATLTETGGDTRTFASTDGAFVVRVLAEEPFGPDVGALRLTASHSSLGVSETPLLVLETAPGSGSFDTNEVSLIDTFDRPDFSGWTFTAGESSLVRASTGGEFHGYMLQMLGPEAFVSQMEGIETADGMRKVRRAFDGNYYVFMKNSPPVVILVAPLSAGTAGIDDPPITTDSDRFLYGYVTGFLLGGWGVVEGVFELGRTAVVEGVRVSPLGFVYVMTWGDRYQGELEFTRNTKDLAVKLAEIGLRVQNDEAEFVAALLAGDETVVSGVSAPYRMVFEFGAELLKALGDEYANSPPEKQGEILGRAVFEIAAVAVAYAKVGQLAKVSKLDFLTRLKSVPFFQHPNTARAFQRLTGFLGDLATTKMCFVAGTKVHTDAGLRNIEDLKAGDRVLSRAPRSREQAYKAVLSTVVTHPKRLYRVGYRARQRCSRGEGQGSASGSGAGEEGDEEGAELVGTAEHPFFVVGREEFVPAERLRSGDKLALAGGGLAEATGLTVDEAKSGQDFTAYNLEVEDFHTYFVGPEGVWVHNIGARECQRILSLYKQYRRGGATPGHAINRIASKLRNAAPEAMGATVEEVLQEVYGTQRLWTHGQFSALGNGGSGANVWSHFLKHVRHCPAPCRDVPSEVLAADDVMVYVEWALGLTKRRPGTASGTRIHKKSGLAEELFLDPSSGGVAIRVLQTGEIKTAFVPTKKAPWRYFLDEVDPTTITFH